MYLWTLAIIAPLLVVIGLEVFHSVTVVFVSYHLVLCLGSVLFLGRGIDLGLRTRRGLPLGIALLVALAVIPPLAFKLLPDLFPDEALLRRVLTNWNIDPSNPGPLLVFMALVNGPAEELFWRGFLQSRLLRGWPSAIALVLLFSSYHLVTIGDLAPGIGGLALMFTGVVAAGTFWTWTRWRWNSLWPALLSHTGATLGYMAICAWLLR